MKKYFPLLMLLTGLILLVASCKPQTVEVTVPVEVTRVVEVPVEVPVETAPDETAAEPAFDLEAIVSAWAVSGHADSSAEAFRHWDEDDPAVVEARCAKCHSAFGYVDFLGADGSAAGAIDNEAIPVGSTVSCIVCHNSAAEALTEVTMPSGVVLTDLGKEARCMVCHQGQASKVSIDTAVAELPLDEVALNDEGKPALRFTNIHYYAAAATRFGSLAKGGYEYEGKTYDGFFAHDGNLTSCVDCHNPHSLELELATCATCHDVEVVEDLYDLREVSSTSDYDGDGDVEEGVYYEIIGLQELLLAAIEDYAANTVGTPIAYDAHTYPYFLKADGSGGFTEWTPRLLKAAYNYQMSLKDPGAFAHGGKYVIQLLFDSIEDLGGDVSALKRGDAGHFDGSAEAFRHWDADDPAVVEADCAKCHSATGLPMVAAGEEITEQPISNGFTCTTCHDGANWPARIEFTSVTFPSGAVVEDSGDFMLCINCHQGRSSTVNVNTAVGDLPADEVALKDDGTAALRFANIHYLAAGATLYGGDVQGGYQFDGKEYVGKTTHPVSDCAACHDVHALTVKADTCVTCHVNMEDIETIRMTAPDYDGDGDTTEGVKAELEGLAELLLAQMEAYAAEKGGALSYNPARYPYFFDEEGKGYANWTPTLLKAAYNYQYFQKEPGAFTHNPKYMAQLLIDSIEALGGDVSGLPRP